MDCVTLHNLLYILHFSWKLLHPWAYVPHLVYTHDGPVQVQFLFRSE